MRFQQKKNIAVIGDIILDEFVFGAVARINPEAPVPIFHIKKRGFRLGGAANVAHNIVSLGGRCTLIGKVGTDHTIQELLAEKNITHHLILEQSASTIRKTRYIANNQQLLRVDDEKVIVLGQEELPSILSNIQEAEVIVIADYGKGMITPALMDALRQTGKEILVDPKDIRPELFRDVFLIKPNLQETSRAVNFKIENEHDLQLAATKLQEKYNSHILITRSEKGMALFEKGRPSVQIPTKAQEVYDVTGAGDTVIATLAMALASGKTLYESVSLANQAAGIVVGKLGTATVTAQELFRSQEENQKVKTPHEIGEIVHDLKQQNAKIVFTNGCFDILHAGHTRLLRKARLYGDILILGLNSDSSIQRLKGSNRPIVKEEDRAEVLSALEAVDYIVFFQEDTPCELIRIIQPDIHVKGGDYNPEDYAAMPEAQLVDQYGGEVKIVSLVEGKSTTSLVEKIRQS